MNMEEINNQSFLNYDQDDDRYYDEHYRFFHDDCYDEDGNIRECSKSLNREFFEKAFDVIGRFMYNEPFSKDKMKELVDRALKIQYTEYKAHARTFRPEVGGAFEGLYQAKDTFNGFESEVWPIEVMDEVFDKLNKEPFIQIEIGWNDFFKNSWDKDPDNIKQINSVKYPQIHYLSFILNFLCTKEVKRIWDYYYNDRFDPDFEYEDEYEEKNKQIWMEDFKYTSVYDRMVNELAYTVAEYTQKYNLLGFIKEPERIDEFQIPEELYWTPRI